MSTGEQYIYILMFLFIKSRTAYVVLAISLGIQQMQENMLGAQIECANQIWQFSDAELFANDSDGNMCIKHGGFHL